MNLRGICFITDKKLSPLPLFELTFNVLKAGVRFVQYRDKEKSRLELYEEALKLRMLTRHFNARLIINDHADIALAVNADGVHLGQKDLPLKEARKILGRRIIGISTHDLEQAKQAEADGADYIGYGPIFHTTTKDAGNPAGVDNLRIIKENVSIPVVAIGGINLDNIEAVIKAGADAAAVATAISRGVASENARKLLRYFRKKIK